MQTIKILNILIFALLITLILQLVLPKPENNQSIAMSGVSLSLESSKIGIPHLPKITVHNNTEEALTIRPCEDIKWHLNSQLVTGIESNTKTASYCAQNVAIAPNEKALLDVSGLTSIFANNPGNYIMTLASLGDNPPMITFSMERPGFFRAFGHTFIYEPIYNLFVAILSVLPGHELGIAIILVTIIIRLILLWPQHKMLENTAKMNKINPKIQALREEYKDNQAELGMKMMELYKKEGVSVGGSCLPILIQMPILLTLYLVISGIADPTSAYFNYSFFKEFDPTLINTLFFGVNLSHIGGAIGIAVGIILGATQWLQAYLSFQYNPIKQPKKAEKKKASDVPEMPTMNPKMMQGMMLYFLPVMLGITAFFLPYGVGLYWFIGTLFVIGQQAYVHYSGKKKQQKGEIVRRDA